MMWQPIETVPDRQPVLLTDGKHFGVGQSADLSVVGAGKIMFDWDRATKPTHWMPLPAPPT